MGGSNRIGRKGPGKTIQLTIRTIPINGRAAPNRQDSGPGPLPPRRAFDRLGVGFAADQWEGRVSASEPTRRTRPRVVPRLEDLESRRLLTGGGGDMFAEIPAQIAQGGGTAAVPFNLQPSQFIRPHGSMTLGIDTSAQPGSHIVPRILAVTDAHGRPLRLTRGVYDNQLRQGSLKGKTATSAVLVTIPGAGHKAPGSA
jgi:hypothetical protein